MNTTDGQSKKGVKLQNQTVALKLVATHPGISRVDIAKITGLTKMTIGNLVSEMIDLGFIEEDAPHLAVNGNGAVGRNPIALKIAQNSPCVLGVSIKRGIYQFILADLAGNLIDQLARETAAPLSAHELVAIVKDGLDALSRRTQRRLLGVGVASIGPVNAVDGVILDPANFHGIRNIPIVDIVRKHTGLPAFLISDGNAGALAEKTFGLGRDLDNYLFLHIRYGIGAGLVLENKLYTGPYGQSGEIGHTTINFAGPKCDCGNTGCLELYANVDVMRNHIRALAPLHPGARIADRPDPTLPEIIDAANSGDNLALSALDHFCDYLAHAVVNTIVLLDVRHIIADFRSTVPGTALETLLTAKMSYSVHKHQFNELRIMRSAFNGQAPLLGAAAVIANKVFDNELAILPGGGKGNSHEPN